MFTTRVGSLAAGASSFSKKTAAPKNGTAVVFIG